jgi:hypothetical protein
MIREYESIDKTGINENNKLIQGKFGEVIYNSPYEITDDDALYLSFTRKIIFNTKFNKSIDNIPDNIIDITLGENFNRKIKKIPKELKYIQLYFYENINITIFKKSNIKKIILTWSNQKNKCKSLNFLPESLEILYLLKYCGTLQLLNIPTNLKELNLCVDCGNHFQQDNTLRYYIQFHNFPNKLEKLTFRISEYDKRNNINYLPNSLKILFFDCKINKVINLPSSLISVDLILRKNKIFKFSIKIEKIKINIDSANILFKNKIKFQIKNAMKEVYIKTTNCNTDIIVSNNNTNNLTVSSNNINIYYNKNNKPQPQPILTPEKEENIIYRNNQQIKEEEIVTLGGVYKKSILYRDDFKCGFNKIGYIGVTCDKLFISNEIECDKLHLSYLTIDSESNNTLFKNLNDNIKIIHFDNSKDICNNITKLPLKLKEFNYKDGNDSESIVDWHFKELIMCNQNLSYYKNSNKMSIIQNMITNVNDTIIELYAHSNVSSILFEKYFQEINVKSYSDKKNIFDGYKQVFEQNVKNIIETTNDDIMLMLVQPFNFVKMNKKSKKMIDNDKLDELINNIEYLSNIQNTTNRGKLDIIIILMNGQTPENMREYARVCGDVHGIIQGKLICINNCTKHDRYFRLKII